nr:TatD family hydrolase [Pseudomonas sp.]
PQAHRMHRVLQQLPLDSIVLETDAPDITPHSHAGQRNSPEFLPDICRELAAIRGIDPTELADASYRNSCELFGWA